MPKNPKSIFPKEVVNFSVEELLQKRSKKSLIIYQLLLIAVISVLAILPIIKVDVSLNANGSVQSKKLETVVNSSINGIVDKALISKNQYVKKGDTLFTFNSDLIDQQILSKSQLIEQKKAEKEDLSHLSENYNTGTNYHFKTAKVQQEYAYFTSSISELSAKLKTQIKIFKREKALYDAKLSSDAKIEASKLELDLLNNQISSFKEKYISQWNNQLQTLNFELNDIELNLNKLKNDKKFYYAIANDDGYIKNMQGIKEGSLVFTNQTLATISPNEELILECYIKPTDIGLIKKDQKINVRVDAYNYQQWGLMTARVEEIINDIAMLNEQTPTFIVRCKPDQTFLELDNGVKGELKKGMSFQSNFIIARRSLFDLLFDKVENWLSPANS